ncbi:DnaJ protein, partial [Lophiostoma macrostomum CBS 122681]
MANIDASKDYYTEVGVSSTADRREIDKVHHKWALKFHPDKNPEEPEKHIDKFKQMGEAFEILRNDEMRAEYD